MNNYSEKFEKMRVAGKLAAECLDMITDHIKPGITTNKIDNLSYEFIQDSCSLELSGMPDVSNGDSEQTIGILSSWTLKIIGSYQKSTSTN